MCPQPLTVHTTAAEMVHSFKFLSPHFQDSDKGHQHSEHYQVRLLVLVSSQEAETSWTQVPGMWWGAHTFSISIWYRNCSAADRKAMQRVLKTTQKTIQCTFTSLEDYRAAHTMKDPTHPAHIPFDPLPLGRRLQSTKARTTMLECSFDPEAVKLEPQKQKQCIAPSCCCCCLF